MLRKHSAIFLYLKSVSESKVFRIFLLSYAMVLIIPLLAGTFSYIKTARAMEQEALKYSQALLSQASQCINMQLISIDQTVKDISTNKKISDFITNTRSTGYASAYDIMEISKELNRYLNTNPFLGKIFIYSTHLDAVITNLAKYPPQLYYNQVTPYTEISFTEWKHLLDRYNDMSFLTVQDIAEAGGKRGILTMFHTLNYDTPALDESYISVGMIIYDDMMKKGFLNIEDINQGVFYLLNQNGDVLMSTENSLPKFPTEKLKQSLAAGEMETQYMYYNEKKMIMTTIKAEKYGWQYVLVMPTDIFMKKVNYIKLLTIGTFFLSMFSGLLIASLWAFKNSGPVLKLLSSLGGGTQMKRKNEYEIIENLVDNIIVKNKHYKELLDNQESVLKHCYTIKAEEQFIKIVRSGNEEETTKFLEAILEREKAIDAKANEVIYCLCFNLLYTYMKISSMVEYREFSFPRIDFDKYMEGNVDPEEMKTVIKDLYGNLCRSIRDCRARQHNNQIVERIQHYIHANYQDPDLCLTRIAEAVSLSPGYISRAYKIITGKNIVDYVNEVRVSNAKSLLEKEGTLLYDIALSVGYISDEAFIKVFKKREGISPGRYREYLKESMTE